MLREFVEIWELNSFKFFSVSVFHKTEYFLLPLNRRGRQLITIQWRQFHSPLSLVMAIVIVDLVTNIITIMATFTHDSIINLINETFRWKVTMAVLSQ